MSTTPVDASGPQVQSFTASDPLLNNANSIHYTLAFSEPVTGVNADDFSLVTAGVSGASIASVMPVGGSNGSQYTITVNTGTADGTITLNLVGASIYDVAGNPLLGGSFLSGSGDAPGHYSLAIGDLNADGKLDLVGANYGPEGSVTLMLGNGDGTFQQPSTNYATGVSNAVSVALADLNGDTKLDVVVSNGNSSTVSVMLGNGDGTLQPPVSYGTGRNSYSVAIADLDGDGKPDLAVANTFDSTISVLLGNGDGTFQPQTIYGSNNPISVAIADLNGDGKLDLALADYSVANVISVMLGNGDGTFQPQVTYAAGSLPYSIAIADLNGDGKLDLAVANNRSDYVSVLLGNGDGTFQPQTIYESGLEAFSVAIADLNGDGKLDLAVATNATGGGSDAILELLGNGDGTFQPPITHEAGFPLYLAIGDLNGDGRPDLAVAGSSVLLNNVATLVGPTYTIDKTAPTLTPVADQTDEATGPNGAVAVFSTTATDNVDGTDLVVFKEGNTVVHSGDTFTLGIHTITASAVDAAGNLASESFSIDVVNATSNHNPVGTSYTYIPLNDPSSAYFTFALDINNSGQIVGRYQNFAQPNAVDGGFLYSGGTFTSINVPGAINSITDALGINDNSQIVGDYEDSTLSVQGFLYSGGTYSNIEFPGASDTIANGINDAGQIVGTYDDTNYIPHGFLYSDGVYTQIAIPGSYDTVVSGINNEGQVSGTYDIISEMTGGLTRYGFVYNINTGTYTTLNDPLATGGTFPLGINDAGQVVGYFNNATGNHAFLYSNGIYTTLSPSSGNQNYALGINNVGEIVGFYSDSSGFIAVPNPTVVADTAHVSIAKTVTANAAQGVLANDTDPIPHDMLTVTAVDDQSSGVGHAIVGSYGTLTLNADGSYSYVADKSLPYNIIAQDVFTYTASEEAGGYATSSLTFTVTNGDGLKTTVIEEIGSTRLVEHGSNYFLEPNGGSAVELSYQGAPVEAGQFDPYGGHWVPIGAEQTASEYEVAWKVTGADQYTVWNTDSNGNYISSAFDFASGSSAALQSFETSFQQDLNGDGSIGLKISVIENIGSTTLEQHGSNYFLEPNGGSAVELSYQGAPVEAGQFDPYGGHWVPIGAEQTASGYEVAWKVTGADQYTVWNTDSNGNYISSAFDFASGSSAALQSFETSFQQDLNGDGSIGLKISVIENIGSTTLEQHGSNYFLEPNGGSAVELSYQGAPVEAGQFDPYGGHWVPIGAEQTASGYEVAWKVTGADQYTVWNTDSNGNYISSAFDFASGSSAALQSFETSFQQDLNGDGSIDNLLISDDGSVNATILVGNGIDDVVSVIGSSFDTVTLGDGDGNSVIAIRSNHNTITLGNGDGNSVDAGGSSNDFIDLGNGGGDSVNVAGSLGGHNTVILGNGAGDIVHATSTDNVTIGDGDGDTVIAGSRGGGGTFTLGDGNNDTAQVGHNLLDRGTTITLGNGNNDTVNATVNDTITLGNGDGDTVTVFGHCTITLGDGDGDTVNAGSFGEHITLGNGDHDTVNLTPGLGFGGDTVVLGNGDGDTVNLTQGGSFSTVTLGNGDGDVVNLYSSTNGGSPSNNTISLGNGHDDVVNDSFGSFNTINLGNGGGTVHVGLGDTINAGEGHDTFIFDQTEMGSIGNVTINHFDPAHDAIQFQNALVTAVTPVDDGLGNAVIAVGGGTVTLTDVHASALKASDFHLV